MIPGKKSTYAAGVGPVEGDAVVEKEKAGSFALFDVEHFIRRIIRNWYWFVLMGLLGYAISYIYSKYYAQRI